MGRIAYEHVNVTGTRTLLDVCLAQGVSKFVYTSSGGVVYNGEQQVISVDERVDYPAKALDAYNESKVAAEKLVLAANCEKLATCSIRPCGIFGPGDRQTIIGFYQVIKANQTRFQIGYNKNLADFTYVANVAHAHLLAVDKLRTGYPCASFRDPISSIALSLGSHRIPTSDAHPLGPNTSPTEADLLAVRKFESDEYDPADLRPVLRNKMDKFASQANNDEPGATCPIAGQAFFITNGEPVFFWDFARAIWRGLGHTPPYIIAIAIPIGMILGTLAEAYSKLRGKEAGFTRYRVALAHQNRYYDIEKARRLLGYEPIVGLEDGMRQWTQWYSRELEKQKAAGETEKTK